MKTPKKKVKDNKKKENQICFKCGKVYTRVSVLNRHLNYECKLPPRFKCSYCDHRSKRKCHIIKHITSIHPSYEITYEETLVNVSQ